MVIKLTIWQQQDGLEYLLQKKNNCYGHISLLKQAVTVTASIYYQS